MPNQAQPQAEHRYCQRRHNSCSPLQQRPQQTKDKTRPAMNPNRALSLLYESICKEGNSNQIGPIIKEQSFNANSLLQSYSNSISSSCTDYYIKAHNHVQKHRDTKKNTILRRTLFTFSFIKFVLFILKKQKNTTKKEEKEKESNNFEVGKLPPAHLPYQQNRVFHDAFGQSQMQLEQCDQSGKINSLETTEIHCIKYWLAE